MGPNVQAYAATCRDRGHGHGPSEKAVLACLIQEFSRLNERKAEPAPQGAP